MPKHYIPSTEPQACPLYAGCLSLQPPKVLVIGDDAKACGRAPVTERLGIGAARHDGKRESAH
jgi:hypothetical protein